MSKYICNNCKEFVVETTGVGQYRPCDECGADEYEELEYYAIKLREKILEETYVTEDELDSIRISDLDDNHFNVHLLGNHEDSPLRLKHEILGKLDDFTANGIIDSKELNVVNVSVD